MQLIALNVLTIVMDILWCLTMRSVWKNKPAKNAKGQKGFNLIRSTTLYLSVANIIVKVSKLTLTLNNLSVVGSRSWILSPHLERCV